MLAIKAKKKLLITFVVLIGFVGITSFLLTKPSLAASSCGGVETSILDCESENNGAIREILWNILDILSVLIGIAGVIGIIVAGIQYMTAGSNEQQVKKSKRRLIEIVLGLAVYILSFAGLKWLGVQPVKDVDIESISVSSQNVSVTKGTTTSITPAFNPIDADAKINCTSSNPDVIQVTSVSGRSCEIKALKDEGSAEIKIEATQDKGEEGTKTVSSSVIAKAKKVEETNDGGNSSNNVPSNGSIGKRLSDTALKFAWPDGQKNKYNAYGDYMSAFKSTGVYDPYDASSDRLVGRSCGQYVSVVYRYAGVDKSLPTDSVCILKYVTGEKLNKSSHCNEPPATNKYKEVLDRTAKPGDASKLQPGDILIRTKPSANTASHAAIVVNFKGKLFVAEASKSNNYARVNRPLSEWLGQSNNKNNIRVFRYIGN